MCRWKITEALNTTIRLSEDCAILKPPCSVVKKWNVDVNRTSTRPPVEQVKHLSTISRLQTILPEELRIPCVGDAKASEELQLQGSVFGVDDVEETFVFHSGEVYEVVVHKLVQRCLKSFPCDTRMNSVVPISVDVAKVDWTNRLML